MSAQPQVLTERPTHHPAGEPARLAAMTIVLFPVRFFLGLGWMRAGTEKLISSDWWTGVSLDGFLVAQRELALPFMPWLIDHEFAPLALPIAFVVMVSQFAIAFALLTTRLLRPALWAAVTLNCVFVAMGAVSPSVFYLVIELTLLAALANGVFGEEQRRPPKPWSIGAKLGAAVACLPYIETLQPAEVIDDPAIILATVATIAAATEALALIGNVDFTRPRETLTRFHSSRRE
ncbi:MAG: hypothetical protein IZT58_01580 [Actinobacteria bacterium]|jgi:hypothetical protein|nr:hypothetical protein [Actinomycetota bacterium]